MNKDNEDEKWKGEGMIKYWLGREEEMYKD